MPWIQNVSLTAIEQGRHLPPGENAMLIQIVDPDMALPVPACKFNEAHPFEFLDIQEDGLTNNGDGQWTDMSAFAITQDQADRLVRLLQRALEQGMNVVVHCVAGSRRSGAVCEVGVMMGLDDTRAPRSPNRLVQHKMMSTLGRILPMRSPAGHGGRRATPPTPANGLPHGMNRPP